MKKLFVLLVLFLLLFSFKADVVYSQEQIRLDSEVEMVATESAEKVEEAVKKDITERASPEKGRLEQYLLEREIGRLRPSNFIQYAIRQAVAKGVSSNTIMLVLMFPLVAGLIAAARHLLGLTGFGIFVPAILAVGFVATGIGVGIVLFLIILTVATISRSLTRGLKMQYMPRMAILMLLVSLGVLGVLLGAVNVGFEELSAVSIFPILILMLLVENFIEVQVGKSRREAIRVTAQTLVMAIVASLIMSWEIVQKFVFLNPELALLLIAMFDIYVGKYVGLRALEYFKFRKILK